MNELMIPLDAGRKEPLYEQIYDYIKQQIVDGNISFREKLPSTRLLAKYLQISRSTIETAYGQLLSEGYIESEPNRGYYASDISDLYYNSLPEQDADEKKSKIELDFIPGDSLIQKNMKYHIDFSPDQIDLTYFPYNIWRKISREGLNDEEYRRESVSYPAGEPELREEIKNYLHYSRGVNATSDQIVIGAGNEYLLILLTQILNSDSVVAMENPTYGNAYYTFLNMQRKVMIVERDELGMSVHDLRIKSPDVIYTMPSHHYPLGDVVPLKRRLELLHWASEKNGRYIIEDDHDSEYRYKGKPIPSLQGNDQNDTVIYLGTFSKSISPTLRMSYMVLPHGLLERYHMICGFYSSTVPRLQQKMIASFFSHGYFERHMNRMRGIYRAKHDFLLAILKKEQWVTEIFGDHAGMMFRIETDSSLSAEEIVKKAAEQNVRAYALSEYLIPGIPYKGTVDLHVKKQLILGYGALSEEEMQEGIRILREAASSTLCEITKTEITLP